MKKKKTLFTIKVVKPKIRKPMPKPTIPFKDKRTEYKRKKNIEPYEL